MVNPGRRLRVVADRAQRSPFCAPVAKWNRAPAIWPPMPAISSRFRYQKSGQWRGVNQARKSLQKRDGGGAGGIPARYSGATDADARRQSPAATWSYRARRRSGAEVWHDDAGRTAQAVQKAGNGRREPFCGNRRPGRSVPAGRVSKDVRKRTRLCKNSGSHLRRRIFFYCGVPS
jgi:hypothetical protein